MNLRHPEGTRKEKSGLKTLKTCFGFISRSKKKPKKLHVEEVRLRSFGEVFEEMMEKEENRNGRKKDNHN